MKGLDVIVYEDLRWRHLPGLLGRWLAGYGVTTLRLPTDPRLRGWVRRWEARGLITILRLREHPHRVYNPSIDTAFEMTEREYDSRFAREALPEALRSLYEDDGIHIAFRKALSEDLQRHEEFRLWCAAIDRTLGHGQQWGYVPTYPERAASVLPVGSEDGLWIRVTTGARARGSVRLAVERIKWVCLAVFSVLDAGVKHLCAPRSQGYPEPVGFAVAIVSPIREFAYGVRGLEFILDGVRIRKDNTLFVPLVALSRAHREVMKDRGLRLAAEPRLPSLGLLARALDVVLVILRQAFSAPPWMSRAGAHLIRERLTWTAFLNRYAPRHFVSYADYSLRHIGRSLTLAKGGVKTWYYADAEFTYETLPGPSYRDIGFGYMTFDYCVSWSERYTRYMKRHHQRIGQYLNVGCLWSEQVRLLKSGHLRSGFPEQLAATGWRPGIRVVGVFDAFYHNDGLLPIEDGTAFARDVARLLNDWPDMFVVFKEKKWPEFYTSEGSEALKAQYRELAAHPRCFFPGFGTSTPEVLALCDLCIAFPFGSPTVEALGAGIKALYYAPNKKYAGGYYDRVPGLVVCGYETLCQRVEELLIRTTDAQYREYLETYVKGDIEPYMDGMGLTRFRDSLCAAGG